jgi:hypothetical protein
VNFTNILAFPVAKSIVYEVDTLALFVTRAVELSAKTYPTPCQFTPEVTLGAIHHHLEVFAYTIYLVRNLYVQHRCCCTNHTVVYATAQF